MQKSLRAFTSSPSETPYTRYLGSTPTPTSTSAAITSGSSTSSVRILAKEVYLTTIISNFYPMDPGVAQTWQDVTTNWVLDYWKKTQRVTKLSVGTLIIKQDPPYSTPGSTKKQRSGQRRVEWQQQMRYLQTPEVTLLFQQTVNYQVPSGITEFPPPESICTEPFATFALRSDYIATLVNASSAFQNITTVSQFKVTDPPPAQPKKPWYALVADQPIILGAVGGGILLCIMVIFTICICRGQKNGGDITINSKQRNEANGNLPNGAGRVDGVAVHGHVPFGRHYSQEQHRRSRDARMDSYIEVRNEKLDDISTLGDPLSPYDKNYLIRQRLNTDASTKTSEQEKTVGPSIINDFDYTKTFGGKFDPIPNETLPSAYDATRTNAYYSSSERNNIKARPSALVSPVSVDQQSVTSDGSFDQAFEGPEERIVVMAPPGKLGVVIDTFDNGEPGVNSIREDSVLQDQLRVGDILVEFDGIDTTDMTALQVSTLIGEKSKNPVRTLVFVRNRKY